MLPLVTRGRIAPALMMSLTLLRCRDFLRLRCPNSMEESHFLRREEKKKRLLISPHSFVIIVTQSARIHRKMKKSFPLPWRTKTLKERSRYHKVLRYLRGLTNQHRIDRRSPLASISVELIPPSNGPAFSTPIIL